MTYSNNELSFMANALRQLSADAVEAANSGHPGMPLGMADVATVLYAKHMRFDAKTPQWVNRDRLILSNGHGSMLLYSALHLLGYEKMSLAQLQSFRTLHSLTAGHPEYDLDAGIETTTGPLGQGLANAVGLAIAERKLHAQFGAPLIDHHTYVFVGDGCLMEGISHEALALAGHLNLHKLVILFDSNDITIDGKVSLSSSEKVADRVKSYGFFVQEIDGHDYDAIDQALTKARHSLAPNFIVCRTVIGKGAPNKAGSHKVHGSPLGKDELEAMRKKLGVSNQPFHIHADIQQLWQKASHSAQDTFQEWQQHIHNLTDEQRHHFWSFTEKKAIENLDIVLHDLKQTIHQNKTEKATRQWSQDVLSALTLSLPNILLGGSADLTASNNTKTSSQIDFTRDNYSGDYINYGIREHGMAAIMNGISLHKGIIPYGGTFLCFSDYMRPAIRLAALMRRHVIFVMTHDSIGLGEDGPTHQPIEHLNALRLIPHLLVLRPADGIETAECWQIALGHQGPSIICLTRQAVMCVRHDDGSANLSTKGAYVLREEQNAQMTLIATGSEVGLACEVHERFAQAAVRARVVSMPSQELFLLQSEEYRRKVIPQSHPTISIEAGTTGLWHRIVGAQGLCIGIDQFGLSAPYRDVYNAMGLTADKIVEKIRSAFDF